MSRADDEARYGPQIDDLYEEELRNLRAEGRQTPKAKPTGNVCPSCVPLVLRKPSGPYLAHSRFCPDHPGEPIPATAYVQGRTWPPSRWRQG